MHVAGYLYDVAWSPARPLVLATGCADGHVYVHECVSISRFLNPRRYRMKCRPDPSASLLQHCWVLAAADTGKLKPEDLYDSALHGLSIGLLRVGGLGCSALLGGAPHAERNRLLGELGFFLLATEAALLTLAGANGTLNITRREAPEHCARCNQAADSDPPAAF
jgi:hypothetical protein